MYPVTVDASCRAGYPTHTECLEYGEVRAVGVLGLGHVVVAGIGRGGHGS